MLFHERSVLFFKQCPCDTVCYWDNHAFIRTEYSGYLRHRACGIPVEARAVSDASSVKRAFTALRSRFKVLGRYFRTFSPVEPGIYMTQNIVFRLFRLACKSNTGENSSVFTHRTDLSTDITEISRFETAFDMGGMWASNAEK